MPNDVVSRAIDAVCAGDHLTADHASAVLAEIMEGRTDPVQTGAFLIALRAKGETVPELVGRIRERVSEEVTRITGLRVRTFDVTVSGLHRAQTPRLH